MLPRFARCILILLIILAVTIPVFSAAASPTGNGRIALTAPPVTTTLAPVTTVACIAPCQCLVYADAVSLWGNSGFSQCAEHPCEVSRSVTGAPAEKYCYKQKLAAAPVSTTPALVRMDRTLPTTAQTTIARVAITRTLPMTTTTLAQRADVPVPGIRTFGNGSFQQLGIEVGKTKIYPSLDTSSPYFAGQFTIPGGEKKFSGPVTISYLEVNQYSGTLPSYTNWPGWGDQESFMIGSGAKEFTTNFRWATAEPDVKGALFQVSRYPFPADPVHWQNQYVPGLVGSGQVSEDHIGYDENTATDYRYFRINFARAANRNPGLPPYFDGTASITQDSQGLGEAQQMTKIPLLNTAIVMTDYSVGSFNFGLPSAFVAMASDEMTPYELGNPNENLQLSCADCLSLRPFTPLETSVSGTEQTYFVRVVPLHADGKAGVPTLPVTVTVQRPKACPAGVTNVQINPPSVKILSFTPTLFAPHDRFPGGPQYFVAIKDPDNCTQKTQSPVNTPTTYVVGSPCYDFMTFAHGQAGWHWFIPPADESHWYDFLPGFLVDIISALNDTYTIISQTWNDAQDFAAEMTAKGWSILLTAGIYQCEDHKECLNAVRSGQSAALSAIGIPPNLPTYDQMMDAGADYLIQVTADELGAGEAYEGMPEEVKARIRSESKTFAKELVGAQSSSRKDQLSSAVGTWFMPDPLYNSPHPATVMVRVYNPAGNPRSTSRVTITVTDSAGLYRPRQMAVPLLAPGEGVAIPVVLSEDYAPFKGGTNCPNDYPDDSSQYPCYMWKWLVHRDNDLPSDTFSASVQYAYPMSAGQDSFTLSNLGPDSSGKTLTGLLQTDPGTQNCPATSSVITYPQGWTMKLDSKTVDPEAMDPDFLTVGAGDGIIRTTCKLPEVC
jgi:hypothetical protein